MKPLSALSIVIGLSFSQFSVSAQQLPEILATGTYKPGIYQSFSEFLRNEPSITENFQIITLSSERKIQKGEGDFKLIMSDSAYTRRDSKMFWGVCDGESIYVNGLQYGSQFKFKKMLGLGRYCYLKSSPPNNYPIATPATLGVGVVGAALIGGASALAGTLELIY